MFSSRKHKPHFLSFRKDNKKCKKRPIEVSTSFSFHGDSHTDDAADGQLIPGNRIFATLSQMDGMQFHSSSSTVVTTPGNISAAGSTSLNKALVSTSRLKTFICNVALFDKRLPNIAISVAWDAIGQVLFDNVCAELKLNEESDYFGLRYYDKHHERQWLELANQVHTQLKHLKVIVVKFRVKFYPPQPLERIQHRMTRYFVYLQLRRDFLQGRLWTGQDDGIKLGALALQEEICNQLSNGTLKEEEIPHFLHTNKIIYNQSKRQEEQILQKLSYIRDYTSEEAETEFIEYASQMETYGIHPYHALDDKKNEIYLGFTHSGVVAYQRNVRIHMIHWNEVQKMTYHGKHFEVHSTTPAEASPTQRKKTLLTFKMDNEKAAKAFWTWAIDNQCFFTLEEKPRLKSQTSGGGFFRRHYTHEFRGRTQKEILTIASYKDPSEGVTSSRASQLMATPESQNKYHALETLPRQHEITSIQSASQGDIPLIHCEEKPSVMKEANSPLLEVVEMAEVSHPLDTITEKSQTDSSGHQDSSDSHEIVNEALKLESQQNGFVQSLSANECANFDSQRNEYPRQRSTFLAQEPQETSSNRVEDYPRMFCVNNENHKTELAILRSSSSKNPVSYTFIILTSIILLFITFLFICLIFLPITSSSDSSSVCYPTDINRRLIPDFVLSLSKRRWFQTLRNNAWMKILRENIVLPTWRRIMGNPDAC